MLYWHGLTLQHALAWLLLTLGEQVNAALLGVVYPVRVSEALATLQHQVEVTLRQQYQDVPTLMV